eukprot:TRINITY_DN33688_c0_g1_i1.p1 TRINITY_DN33688_c0_g1~~TRINITY_DN33688_c0_g1_i1.p1  ORF type:complete len:368 (-),score=36.85 TRINITY_DN33688_c0_g1_i1:1049-2152(-)
MLSCFCRRDPGTPERYWHDDSEFTVRLRPTGFRHLKTTHASVVHNASDVLCVSSSEVPDTDTSLRAVFLLQDRTGGATYKVQAEPVDVYALFGRRWHLVHSSAVTDHRGCLAALLHPASFAFGSVTPLAAVLRADGTVARSALWRVPVNTPVVVVDVDAVFPDPATRSLALLTPTYIPPPARHATQTLNEWHDRGFFLVYIAPAADHRATAAAYRALRNAPLPPGAVLLAPSPDVASPRADQLPPGLSVVRHFRPDTSGVNAGSEHAADPAAVWAAPFAAESAGTARPDDASGSGVPRRGGAGSRQAHAGEGPVFGMDVDVPIPTRSVAAAQAAWAEALAQVQHEVATAAPAAPRYVPPRSSWLWLL